MDTVTEGDGVVKPGKTSRKDRLRVFDGGFIKDFPSSARSLIVHKYRRALVALLLHVRIHTLLEARDLRSPSRVIHAGRCVNPSQLNVVIESVVEDHLGKLYIEY